jgi:hypothetical protein
MNSEDNLIQKLMISKQIMDKHNQMPRSGDMMPTSNYNTPEVESYEPVKGSYNIPQEYLQESQQISQPYLSTPPTESKMPQPITNDRVMASKLPDAIKRLMIEHPIEVPNSMGGGTTLSNELVEKASRLMGTTPKTNQPVQNRQPLQEQTSLPNVNQLKSLLREVVEEVLQENGILTESTQKSNEQFTFKVGKHIFEGKISKVRKTN